MGWTIEDIPEKKYAAELTDSDEKKWKAFVAEVKKGADSKTADEPHRLSDCKKLTSSKYQVRLSGKQRATFALDDKAQKVKVLQVGGHT